MLAQETLPKARERELEEVVFRSKREQHIGCIAPSRCLRLAPCTGRLTILSLTPVRLTWVCLWAAMGAAGQAEARRQQPAQRNIGCSAGPDSGWGIGRACRNLGILGIFITVTLWLCALNSQRLYYIFLAPCSGPVLQPETRKTPWCKSFAKELVKEVETSDAGSVCEYAELPVLAFLLP